MQSAAVEIYRPQDQDVQSYMPSTTNDTKVIEMWLHGKARKTQIEYKRDLAAFMRHAQGMPLKAITLDLVQSFVTAMGAHGYKPRTINRRLAAIKSLLSFAAKIGYCRFNVGAAVKGPKPPNDLGKRILTEEQVIAMIQGEPNRRNRALLRMLYVSGARAAEIHGLTWGDCSPNQDGTCTVHLFGKGGKSRFVVVPMGTWESVAALRGDAADDAPVFLSRKRNALSTVQIWRIVRAAAERVGINKNVSPHWMRHACASHALQRGCNVGVVQATLGHSSLAVTSVYVHVKPSDSAGLYLAVS